MSEVNNPLFENQKEFLERQKDEYKNALLNDVTQLKTQSQQIGKTLLIAGGALAGLWMVSGVFRNKKKGKTAQLKKGKTLALPAASSNLKADNIVKSDGSLNYEEALNQEPVYGAHTSQPHQGPSFAQSILHSDITKAVTQQVTAFLLVFLTKKLEEYLQHNVKINDIASSREPETRDIDFSYHEEDAI